MKAFPQKPSLILHRHILSHQRHNFPKQRHILTSAPQFGLTSVKYQHYTPVTPQGIRPGDNAPSVHIKEESTTSLPRNVKHRCLSARRGGRDARRLDQGLKDELITVPVQSLYRSWRGQHACQHQPGDLDALASIHPTSPSSSPQAPSPQITMKDDCT